MRVPDQFRPGAVWYVRYGVRTSPMLTLSFDDATGKIEYISLEDPDYVVRKVTIPGITLMEISALTCT